jgi:hypothetical protein
MAVVAEPVPRPDWFELPWPGCRGVSAFGNPAEGVVLVTAALEYVR